ncbi:MAG: hypothetical protein CMO01_28020 [Thalassobius sp.]|nr:hypothetical protein [Thalassovita sp.]
MLIILIFNFKSEAQSRRYPKRKQYSYKHKNHKRKRNKSRYSFNQKNDFNHNISLLSGYNFGLGNMNTIYKPTPGFYLNYLYREDNMAFGGQIGYLNFQTRQDTFYIWDNGWDELGIVQYSNLLIIPLEGLWRYYLPITNQFELVTGFGLGYYYTKVDYTVDIPDPAINASYSFLEGKGAVTPILGFQYNLANNVDFFFSSKYNLFFSLGSADENDIEYNSNLGQVDHFISTNLGLVLKF